MDPLAAEGHRRDALHAHSKSTRNLAKGSPHEIGLRGEHVFAREFELPMNLNLRIEGDGGYDFILPTWFGNFEIDVKTREYDGPRPLLLLVESCKCNNPDRIYVLAHRKKVTDVATLMGWTWAKIITRTEARDYCGTGVVNHALPLSALRPMETLHRVQVKNKPR